MYEYVSWGAGICVRHGEVHYQDVPSHLRQAVLGIFGQLERVDHFAHVRVAHGAEYSLRRRGCYTYKSIDSMHTLAICRSVRVL